jgi:hypothetical protein
MLGDEEMKQTLRAVFEDRGSPTTTPIEMKPFDLDQNLEEFIKAKMEEELVIVENPTQEQIEGIIRKKIKRKPRAKVVFFKDFIDERTDFLDSEIIEKPIRVKIRNEEL